MIAAWARSHAAALRDALGRLFAAPLGALLSLLAIGIALALPAGGLVLIENLQALGRGLSGSHEISIFLATDVGKQEIAEIERRLRTEVPGTIRFVARDVALKELQATEGLGDLLAGLPRNPLPDAFVVRPNAGAAAEFEGLATQIGRWPKVAHVQIDSSWVRRLDALLRFGRLFVGVLGAILGAGLLAVVFNTIRLQVLGRREEVELALLIGATPAFVARPFIWFGVIEGGLGGLVALALVAGASALTAGPAGELIALYGGSFVPQRMTPAIGLGVIAGGGLLGLAAGWLSTRTIGRR